MRPETSFLGQPIRALQTMLRVIAKDDPRHEKLVPDGIYGPETVRAVSVFQRLHALPVTGVTDLGTWEAVRAAYEPALIQQDQAAGLFITLDPGQVIRRGERSPHVLLVQAMLQCLSDRYANISQPSLSGTLDGQTASSLSSFQVLAALPATGELDKITWKQLTLHYPLAADRQQAALSRDDMEKL